MPQIILPSLLTKFFCRHKCLSWTVEWITADGVKTVRNAVLETCSVAEAYDRCCPRSKGQEPTPVSVKTEQEKGDHTEITNTDTDNIKSPSSHDATTKSDDTTEPRPDQPSVSEPSGPPAEKSTETCTEVVDYVSSHSIAPYRDLYFYLHRPRTSTKKPVIAPLLQSATLSTILRNRTVLEFPTIYALPESAERILANQEDSPYIMEEEYLRTAGPEETRQSKAIDEDDAAIENPIPDSSVNLHSVDENKVLEVLKQDLFEPVPDTDSAL